MVQKRVAFELTEGLTDESLLRLGEVNGGITPKGKTKVMLHQ